VGFFWGWLFWVILGLLFGLAILDSAGGLLFLWVSVLFWVDICGVLGSALFMCGIQGFFWAAIFGYDGGSLLGVLGGSPFVCI